MGFYYILREQKNLQMILSYLSDDEEQGFFKLDTEEKINTLESLLNESEVKLIFGDYYHLNVRVFSLEELKEEYQFMKGYIFQEAFFYWEGQTYLSRKTGLYQTPDTPLFIQNERYRDQGEHTFEHILFYCQQISE